MNIIALSLGLIPIPPVPVTPEAAKRAETRAKQSEAGERGAGTRTAGPTMRRQILELLRDTGPATTMDLASYYVMRRDSMAWHLQKLQRDGLIELVEETNDRGRLYRRWHFVPQPSEVRE